jgi:hypothetical protein
MKENHCYDGREIRELCVADNGICEIGAVQVSAAWGREGLCCERVGLLCVLAR